MILQQLTRAVGSSEVQVVRQYSLLALIEAGLRTQAILAQRLLPVLRLGSYLDQYWIGMGTEAADGTMRKEKVFLPYTWFPTLQSANLTIGAAPNTVPFRPLLPSKARQIVLFVAIGERCLEFF